MSYVLLILQNDLLDLRSACRKLNKVTDCLNCQKEECPMCKPTVEDFWTLSVHSDLTIIKKMIKGIISQTRAILLVAEASATLYIYQAKEENEELNTATTKWAKMYECFKKAPVKLEIVDLRGVPIDLTINARREAN